MYEQIKVTNLTEASRAVAKLYDILNGKKIDIVSFNSLHNSNFNVLEDAFLKIMGPVHIGTLIKIPLEPRRSICFDVKESPVITFESERQIVIVRKLQTNEILTKVILIHK